MVDQEAMFDDEEAMCVLMYFLVHTSSFDLGCDICTTLPHLVKIIVTSVLSIQNEFIGHWRCSIHEV